MAGDLDLVRRLIKGEQGLAIVSTTRADGSVHSSLVNAGVLDEGPLGGGPVVATVIRGDAHKLAHFTRTGIATLTFRVGWQWVSVDGPVTMIGPGHTADGFDQNRLPGLLRDIFTSAGGTHDDWTEYDRVMATEGRVAVLVTPTRIIGNATR
jgi:PPOX class probable F420-dependent enzyme